MAQGTITLTNGSNQVTGDGTDFSSVKAGDFINTSVGGVPYTIAVNQVWNTIELQLVLPFDGPTATGLAFDISTARSMALATMGVTVQAQKALRMMLADEGNWRSIYSNAATVTVQTPDGGTFTGPSWGRMSADITNLSSNALTKGGNLSGIADTAAARTNLGLKGLATKDSVALNSAESTGVLPVSKGGSGFGTVEGFRQTAMVHGVDATFGTVNNILTYFNTRVSNGGVFSFRDADGSATHTFPFGASILSRTNDTFILFSANHNNGNVRVSAGTVAGGIAQTAYINNLWGSRNTTVDPNGFIKSASPIVKIFSDGRFETNEDSEGVVVERIGAGVYKVSGCLGLNSDPAWGGVDGGIEIPVDVNKQPKLWVDYRVRPDGAIEVRTYHRTHPSAPEFARNIVEGVSEGDPVDIPGDVFVSVRVNMPDAVKE